MTTVLSQAFQKAAQLPDTIQDEIAAELMEDLESEARWQTAFAQSQPQLLFLATM